MAWKYRPIPKTRAEKRTYKGRNDYTTKVSKRIGRLKERVRKLPKTDLRRAKLMKVLADERLLARGATFFFYVSIFEGYYNIGATIYCTQACCRGTYE